MKETRCHPWEKIDNFVSMLKRKGLAIFLDLAGKMQAKGQEIERSRKDFFFLGNFAPLRAKFS